jgi:dTDP-4-dehydrorhamnose reductase
MRVLVSGASGMLGSDLTRAGTRAGHEVIGFSHAQMDITDEDAVTATFERLRPDAAVNCAAWTDVDGAERAQDQAFAVNGAGAGNVARAAAAGRVPCVHVSTDYVFSGEAPRDRAGNVRPYVESDATGPRSVYGASKLEGERQVLAVSPRHTVVRSSWLFGTDGANFVDTMLRLAGAGSGGQGARGTSGEGSSAHDAPVAPRASVRVVTDQIGSPTWTGHLAPALVGVLERELAGLLHLAGGGHVSWNAFAKEIFSQARIDCEVEEATSAEMARPAPRPAWSALASERADSEPLPDWREGLAGYLSARLR